MRGSREFAQTQNHQRTDVARQRFVDAGHRLLSQDVRKGTVTDESLEVSPILRTVPREEEGDDREDDALDGIANRRNQSYSGLRQGGARRSFGSQSQSLERGLEPLR